jgi:hypothetical protein
MYERSIMLSVVTAKPLRGFSHDHCSLETCDDNGDDKRNCEQRQIGLENAKASALPLWSPKSE